MRVAVLWLAAALISGFTLRRYLGPLDEGILMQAATRMADGQWPWRDFSWAYGPGEPLYVMAMGKAFGPSLLWWRLLRVAADATAAVLVWSLARPAGERWALAAWAAAALTAAQPVSANPTAPALALGLAAVLLATRGRPAWAGAAAGAAAFWRPDIGAAAALAAAWAAGANLKGPGPFRLGGSALGRAGPVRSAAVCLLVAALVGAVLYAPFVVAAGPGAVWDALVVQATRDGEWWRLPFPAAPSGDVKDVLTWLLPYAALVILALSIKRPLVILGAGLALYFYSRADLEHAQALLIVSAALAALVKPRAIGAVVLGLLIVVGAANRANALLRPPDLASYKEVRVPREEADALRQVEKLVHQLVPPGEPIYVAPLRSDLVTFSHPLLHYLVDRPNVLNRDVLLQAKPEEQRKIIAKLPRAKVIIRWTNPESAKPEPNRRGRPSGSTALDDYIAEHYTRRATFGDYEVLASR